MCSILREVTHHKNVPLFSGQEPQHFMLFKLKVVNHLGLRSSFTALRVIKCFTASKLQVFLIMLLILSCSVEMILLT